MWSHTRWPSINRERKCRKLFHAIARITGAIACEKKNPFRGFVHGFHCAARMTFRQARSLYHACDPLCHPLHLKFNNSRIYGARWNRNPAFHFTNPRIQFGTMLQRRWERTAIPSNRKRPSVVERITLNDLHSCPCVRKTLTARTLLSWFFRVTHDSWSELSFPNAFKNHWGEFDVKCARVETRVRATKRRFLLRHYGDCAKLCAEKGTLGRFIER